jgi:quercetin dioxygenase-like cupin family protein
VNAASSGIQIETDGPKDMLVTSIAVDPGGSFGWHTHPGPVLVSVATGTLTFYRAERHECQRGTFTAGQGFIEDGGDVHLARNETSDPVLLYVTFLAHTGTTAFLTEAPEPALCSGS